LLVLVLSALVAGIVYWACGEIAFNARRRFVSAAAAAHGSVLLGFSLAIEAWSFDLDATCFSMATMDRRGRELYRRPRPVADPDRAHRACCVAAIARSRMCGCARSAYRSCPPALILGTSLVVFAARHRAVFSAPM